MPFSQLKVGRRMCSIHCSPWRAHTGAGEKCEKEGAEESNCYILTLPTSILSPVMLRGGRGVLSEGLMLSLGKGGRRGVVLMFVFVSHYRNPFLLDLATVWLSLWTAEIALSAKEDKDSPQLPGGLMPRIPGSAQLGRKEHWKGSLAIMESMLEDRLCNPEPKLLTISMRFVFSPLG